MADTGSTPELRQSPAVLNSFRVDSGVHLNRAHAAVYSCAILSLVYHHALSLRRSPTFLISLALALSDLVFAFMWVLSQALRWRPVRGQEFPERLAEAVDRKDWPGLDVFVCTADPHKEPPMGVVNNVLSTMALDYPAGKLSVYVSDDGGAQVTLFALVEAARFAGSWLPFCRERGLVDRCPAIYLRSDGGSSCPEGIKMMYQTMKEKVENVAERGWVRDEDMPDQAFGEWTPGFTRQEHPSIIQVLLDSSKDVDVTGHVLPNLVYVSREKNKAYRHNFKAGALNALVRVSGAMSNAPVILTLDCDMYCNDPRAAQRALCYMLDPALAPRLAYVQFPQRFQGLDENDIYANEHKRLSQVHPTGMNGLRGPMYLGTGCFFARRSLYGRPSSQCSPVYPNDANEHVDDGLTAEGLAFSETALKRARQVTSCTFEHGTKWGSKIGFRYGTIVEDFYTGYHLHCEGWKSIFCHPQRPAFLGEMPVNLDDVLGQVKRWCIGFLEVAFSKYCPLTYGTRKASFPMGMCYSIISFWGMWCFPISAYSILPQMALAHHIPLFPKGFGPWFWLYAYLFLAANAQDLVEFLVAGGTLRRWWNDQRMWMIRGVTTHLFGVVEFSLKQMGLPAVGFNLTSKVMEAEQSMRYKRGVFDFGVESPFFVSLGVVGLVNSSCFLVGLARTLRQGGVEDMFLQLFLSGFITINCWPIYEAMFLRSDSGRMPRRVSAISVLLTGALHIAAYFLLET
ncbi:hypothetical protein Taro_032006 [Colocasia esculenta]|uniref:Cellulose synthase-like protein G3 n=1 Tax=Colocasia esculenta TaxID=4460 RepID=A0A843VTL2_COLES|nr:hypothetical protein [Colocasia esculenta]